MIKMYRMRMWMVILSMRIGFILYLANSSVWYILIKAA